MEAVVGQDKANETPEALLLAGGARVLLEGPIGIPEAKAWLETALGITVHADTIRSWCDQGIELPDGSRLFLEHAHVGGKKLVVSRLAITRMILRKSEAMREARQAATATEGVGDHVPA